MKKSDFRALCKSEGRASFVKIEEALIELLKTQPNRTIEIPSSEYLDEDGLDEDDVRDCLVDYLTSGESILVSRTDANDSESYIASIRLTEKDAIEIRVYGYYEGGFRDVNMYSLCDSKDAMRFALEYGVFEDEEESEATGTAGLLTDRQLDLLDEFTAAAARLNEAGVTLVWDEDDECLCVVNRDKMKDGSFFVLDPSKGLPKGSLSVKKTATDALEVEVVPVSRDSDCYYFPENS